MKKVRFFPAFMAAVLLSCSTSDNLTEDISSPQVNMKKILSALFVACLLQAKLLGCATDTTDHFDHTLEPFYTNNSGVAVKLTIRGYCEKEDNSHPCIQEIKNNDTLCNYYMQGQSCAAPDWLIPSAPKGNNCDLIKEYSPNCEEPIPFKIEFLSQPKVCLVFDGEIEGENDIRYWKNYAFTEKVSIGDSYLYYSYYYITPELMQQAKEEYCQ